MAHIDLGNDLPGIRGPMAYSPATARPLNELAEILLRSDDNSLSRGERELIGAYTSSLNDCFFCQNVHGSLAQHYLGCDMATIDAIKLDPQQAPISEKMKALLPIAAAVRRGGRHVTPALVEKAGAEGATDREIHDTVLTSRRLLYVQPLCRRPGNLGAARPAGVRRSGAPPRGRRVYRF
ncbi:carboxymuconolactone decarboxylase family protein [Puia sp. P3]|uniref:carboxymuconolactone decarboxylase family protein n=1 Tax=Puia sp. P3 TaxID=3423952 RepID=UPI003D680022